MKNIVILSLARFDDTSTSATFELANEFIKSNQVLIVEHPYTWTELIRGLSKKKGWVRLIATISFRPIIKVKGSIKILIPPAVIPTNFLSYGDLYRKLSTKNQQAIAKRVNAWFKKEKWDEYVYINSYNYHFPDLNKHLVGNQVKNAYHCVDPIVKPYTMKHGLRNQKKAVGNADLVISTAPQLQKEWEAIKPSYLVPNGVDYQHFNSAQKYDSATRNLGNKLIGYFGAIERRIDYELLEATFKANPDWTLLLAGPVQNEYVPSGIGLLPNIHFMGKYDYKVLPSLIYSVDVTMIPFKMEEASRSIYPLKLYEYMSTGKPIVCTMFNTDLLVPIMDKVYVAKDLSEMEEAIDRALNEQDVEKQLSRKTFASINTWEHRAKRFLNYLNKENYVQTETSY